MNLKALLIIAEGKIMKTTETILREAFDHKISNTDKWFSEEEYNDLKDIYELTKISHAEMCEEVIKLRKYIEQYKFNIEQLQKELKEQFENDLILVEEDIDKIFNYYKV
jgi:hypothetical protein